MPPMRPTMLQTFTEKVRVNGGLEKAPRKRREAKVKNSLIGFVIMAGGMVSLGYMGFLASRPTPPSNLILGGGVVVGGILLAFGGLAADRETFGPVLKTLIGLGERVEKARRR